LMNGVIWEDKWAPEADVMAPAPVPVETCDGGTVDRL